MARSGRPGLGSGRIIAVVIAAVIVAELAVLLLGPSDPLSGATTPPLSDYFDSAQVERARDFREGQLWLFLIGLLIELAALGALAAGRPRRIGELLRNAGERPLLGGFAAGAGIAILLALAGIPTGLIAHERAVDAGLSTQGLGSWVIDLAKSAGISTVLAGLGATILLALQRRLRRTWWVVAGAVVFLYAVTTSWLAPVVLAPLFNDFERLPDGPVRTQVLDLADRAGVDVGEVYTVDASRRSTSINAYVNGIGSSKRVVLYDNLINDAPRAELRSVLAHELGHVEHRDILRGLTFVAIVVPLGMAIVAFGGAALARRRGAEPGTPAALPAFVLVISVVLLGFSLIGNQLSRSVEADADAFALELTDDPAGFIALQQRLSRTNLSDPDPQNPFDVLLRSHPSSLERIGAAVEFESR